MLSDETLKQFCTVFEVVCITKSVPYTWNKDKYIFEQRKSNEGVNTYLVHLADSFYNFSSICVLFHVLQHNRDNLLELLFATFLITMHSAGLLFTTYSFWNNIEIVDISFMQRRDVVDFIQAIDESKGIFLYRWGDAPLRYIMLALFAKPIQILHRRQLELGYCHPC